VPDKLISRLDDNERILVQTHDLVTEAAKRKRRNAPAAEWLLDNFYLIEEQIRTARRHLPRSYSRELPQLATGTVATYPRVYSIALELISHVDGHLDSGSLNGFITSYQTVASLKLGELWALPIMLRLALIENLRRVAARMANSRKDRDVAADWAERMVDVVERNPTDLILVMADMARANPPLSGAFLSEMTRHLHGQSPHFAFANSWLAQRLAEQGLTIEQLVSADGQAQAADQVSMGNSITSLRYLSSNDWRKFVEEHSVVEQVLREDPVYSGMDFSTRDRYRHVVEEIAKRSHLSEQDIAIKAMQLAQAGQRAHDEEPRLGERENGKKGDSQSSRFSPSPLLSFSVSHARRRAHVGYYLIDHGRAALEDSATMRLSPGRILSRLVGRWPLFVYLTGVLLIMAGVMTAAYFQTIKPDAEVASYCLLAIPFLTCAAHLGVAGVNWLTTLLVTPRPLPRLDFSDGIPREHRTIVVVPTMLTNPDAATGLLEGLEVRYLANRDDNLHFALLTDFEDASQEVMPNDANLLRLVSEGVENLNQKYAHDHFDIFFLFHRPRRWNAQEGVWMGHERKRGKLADFNAFLRGARGEENPRREVRESGRKGDSESLCPTLPFSPSPNPPNQGPFVEIIGETAVLADVRYVITLDTDTQLPRDSARAMVGAMAHPLNRPVVDPKRRRVVAGYGILQPRVGVSLPSAHRSLFVRLFAGDAGVDPYTRAVSDVYQDLFGEGSFIGKGIYDVEAFETCCCGFPENAILSHDLLESTHARSALLSDVELFEEFPSRYPTDVSRRHRWMRGDWQIFWWLLPWVPARKDEVGGMKDESTGQPSPRSHAPAWERTGFPGSSVGTSRDSDSSLIAHPSSFILSQNWVRNPISALSWWKIFDNLRRSLVPIAMLLVLLLSWVLLESLSAASVTLFVLISVGAVPLLAVLADLVRKPSDLPTLTHLRVTLNALGKQAWQFLCTFIFLPYEAYISSDAIARTLVRMLVTKKKLLEWKTSSAADRTVRAHLAGFVRSMWIGPLLSAATIVVLALREPAMLFVAGPLLGLWLVLPLVAWWLSRTLDVPLVRLSEAQRVFLRKLSRRTWRFFEVFVTEEENWLPPDNFQEQPGRAVASRTSPTNIGVALLADLAACDFGYCSPGRMLDRVRKTLGTLARMERYRGHFFNWYDTRSLKPLFPLYISTVDSGNLAGHLLVLRSGLLEQVNAKVLSPNLFGGLCDTIRVLGDAARGLHCAENRGNAPLVSVDLLYKIERLEKDLERMSDWLRESTAGENGKRRAGAVPKDALSASVEFLQRLLAAAGELTINAGSDPEVRWWASAFERSCRDQQEDLLHVAAWAALPAPPAFVRQQSELRALLARLETVPRFGEVAAMQLSALPLIDATLQNLSKQSHAEGIDCAGAIDWLGRLRRAIAESAQHAADRMRALEQAARECEEFGAMDFSFLFETSRDLFSIGYNVGEQRRDNSYYDLLASEARLASFLVVAIGEVGQEHWFALGRMLTSAGGASTLLSWSGSMFEYLMPLLVMPTYENTLLDQTYRAAVRRQIDYGQQRGVPWGFSESGFYSIDAHLNYQYRAFGVPGLGLKRGLAEDLVIAPYASVLALMVAPEEACQNLEQLAAQGHDGPYGMYEAVDYTSSRLPRGATSVDVRQFMAHHEGMSLLALAYVLLDKPMQRRFLADPMMHAAVLLLQERVPKAGGTIFPHVAEASTTRTPFAEEEGAVRVFTDPSGPVPEVHLLSNGRYHVVITSAGGGHSRWRDLAVTRWREDPTRDCWGTFCFLRDLDSGALWSNAWQPTHARSKRYQAIFTQTRAEFRRSDDRIDTHTEISVSPEDDIELRRLTITNRSKIPRTIELTSYAEVVLAPAAQDLSHPAFSNLFVQTELVRERHAILCTRRPRSAQERPPWLMHLMNIHGTSVGEASFETDRMKFIGRGRTLAAPLALIAKAPLSGSNGPVLDPVVCIRRVVLLRPRQTVRVDLVTGVGETREVVTAMTEKYSDPRLADRVFELAWTHSQVLLRQLNATEADAQGYGRLAGSIIFASALRRGNADVLLRNRRGQSGLWGYGISGDLPIVLIRIRDRQRIELVRQVLQVHAYWRMKGVSVDLVIWNEDDSVYRQTFQDAIMDLVAASPEAGLVDKPGGIFVRRGEHMSEEDRALLQTVARVVLVDDAGTLSEQIEPRGRTELAIPLLKKRGPRGEGRGVSQRSGDVTLSPFAPLPQEPPKRDLAFFNGLGGFSRDGREYVMIVDTRRVTPAPWVNVIANPHFGTVVSESGGAYTWSENSHEFRLTPWYNDAVCDTSGEAVFLRDEETGRYWSPSPLPARGRNPYVARHGFGYTIFEYYDDGIVTEFCHYVATDAPVKFIRLKIANRCGRPRQLSLTGYWELVLGELRDKTLMHVVTKVDPVSGAFFACNPYSPEFADRVVFVDSSETLRTVTGDRTEFLGRNGSPANPAALRRVRLSGCVGAGFDPCAAMQVQFTLEDTQEKEVIFLLGAASSEDQARQLTARFRSAANAYRALEGVWHYWSRTLGVAYFETPDQTVNFLANGWLIYQTLSARMWGRTGYYQSGGAYGFRDQLQDATALVHAEPALLREHLLRAAARQFCEGDVQHWWHPPAGRGVRTHFSDDLLWLVYATCRYCQTTGDIGVLQERVPFLRARALRPDEEANYDLPQVSDDVGTLFEHCVRAIDHSLKFGPHGLPLMGCGDWNDGMNLVGQHGKGESVWLGFFLYDVLIQFIQLARRFRDEGGGISDQSESAQSLSSLIAHSSSLPSEISTFIDRYTVEAGRLRGNIEEHGWDGAWYRRAYFDDGTPLGSALNTECQIDSISQSWSILSGAGTSERSALAMDNAVRRLVRSQEAGGKSQETGISGPQPEKTSQDSIQVTRDSRFLTPGLIQLLDPPFDKSDLNPGYIKGYVPGVRENGGQYTHAAIWMAMALAAMGDSKRAWELFWLINPVPHAVTPEAAALYRVEPYVVAADVYAVPPHTGRGGWTWYTGSAGWMYRLITESLLGLRLDVDKLRFAPCPPVGWSSYKIHYRYRETFYHINLAIGERRGVNSASVKRVVVDGNEKPEKFVPLVDDRIEHQVVVELE
jgi:cellobiose phosphorylase